MTIVFQYFCMKDIKIFILQFLVLLFFVFLKLLLYLLSGHQELSLKSWPIKPFQYATTDLYSECQELTVRQLFVLSTIINKLHNVYGGWTVVHNSTTRLMLPTKVDISMYISATKMQNDARTAQIFLHIKSSL